MVIGIIGESCTGKSTLAEALHAHTGGKVWSGRDYLRLAKNEGQAKAAFISLLRECAAGGEPLIYVISAPEQLELLPPTALRVVMTAELDTIKARFAARMHGVLPPPVAAMLEKKHGEFDAVPCALRLDGSEGSPEEQAQRVLALL